MKLKLSDRIDVAEGTLGAWLVPEGKLDFAPGQFGDFTLPGLEDSDGKGATRAFSFACAPGGDRILIATRQRGSAFKRALAEMPSGSPVELDGPMGGFTLHRDAKRPAVFLVGGIGITPVRSIVEHAARERTGRRITVLHANRSEASTPFLADFRRWAAADPGIDYVPTLDGEAPSGWADELGVIDAAMIARHAEDLHAPVYYVVGPPGMVEAMKALLDGIGIDELQVRTEEFPGY